MANVVAGIKGFVSIDRATRFWAKVDKSGECWLWTGAKRSSQPGRDHGMFWDGGCKRSAHVVAWELEHGQPFPVGMDGCHTCDNPPCVRPSHVFPGTAYDNAHDAIAKGRYVTTPIKSACPNGHPRTPDYVPVRGCRLCHVEATRQWRARARASRP